MSFDFRSIWIVGASTGIGRACALAYAKAGIKVVASARSMDGLNSLVVESGGAIIPVRCDVADTASVEAAVAQTRAALGSIDCLLFSAASWSNDAGSQAREAAVAPTLNVNVLGALRLIERLLPEMKARASGRIVLISSVAGFRGLPRGLAYGSSKAALTHIAECLRLECHPQIIIQVIHPGFVKTPLTDQNDFPMPFLVGVDVAVQRILRGMAGNRFEITFPRRFTYLLKLLRILPYALYFPLVQRMTGTPAPAAKRS